MTQGEGRLLGGRYRLESVLGRGGMGTVWLAGDEVLGRSVAVKEVIAPRGLDDTARDVLYRRMLREARAAARLSHPGIVVVHDVVEEEGAPWIVMEYVRAGTLQDSIDASGPLPAGRVAEIGRQVLGALRAAHAAGILHRDVKPANVMLADDRVILTDFGVAQLEGDATLTQTGIVMGSPAYLSPERAQGLKPGPASDLWALGMLLYTACEGVPPFERPEVLSTLAAVMMEPLPTPTRAGPLVPVIVGLLEKDPEARLDGATAAEMLHRAHAEATTMPATPPRRMPDARRSGDTYDSLFLPRASAMVTTPDPARHLPRQPPPAPRPAVVEVPVARDETLFRPTEQVTPAPPPPARPPARRGFSWRLYVALAASVAVLLAGGLYAFQERIFGGSDGYQRRDAFGFTVSVPKGWLQSKYDQSARYVRWEDPDGEGYFQFDLRDWSNGSPGLAPEDSFTQYPKQFKDYRKLSLKPVDVGGQPGAELRHRFREEGTNRLMQGVNRRYVVNDEHVALFTVFPREGWNQYKAIARFILDSCES
ncbi:serine/threonine protein kinase [Actinocorallia sp. API 0066]|uniref:serine/threonine-protein kinase n=1 Tax=Actinocorallia sp. API 0066 TaxID=2896846 RepID=UPI001E6146E2|nr:serine/threonine-protein kinase [Actinocorallia sp. API 0066]MCD0451285.1 serine/threonine protein kinase [Actinocorallia sp. API 0066]